MGKVEKIVVLSVLFVVVLILVVSLDRSGGGDGTDEVLAKESAGVGEDAALSASRLVERERGIVDTSGSAVELAAGSASQDGGVGDGSAADESSVGASAGKRSNEGFENGGLETRGLDESTERDGAGEAAPSGLLVAAQVRRPVYEVPKTIPEDWALRTLAGLADHLYDPTHKVYQAKAGDTWKSLAKRYYGDVAYAALLRRANEGQEAPVPGRQILIPTHDDGVTAESKAATLPKGSKTYVAGSGESLWVIAKKNYGKGHKWPLIWEANRDRLKNPDFVPEGVTLVIPPLKD